MNMRALCVHSESLENLIVLELDQMRYVDNVKSAKYGTYSGLMLYAESARYCIRNLSLETCNEICRTMLVQGYVDLSQYGEYEIW